MLKSGLLLSTGNILVALLGLVRNVLIARLLSIDDFGIASTFAITMALVEMASNMALDRLIVQAKDGDAPVLQSTLHSIQMIRGIAGAAFFYLIAEPIAWLFGIPEAVWAYQLLAIVPFLRGCAHLDMFRFQREMRFMPFIWTQLTAQGFSTIAAIPLVFWLNDYSAMLYAILLQQLLYSLVSHLVAERSYKLSWDIPVIRRAIRFGWPILLNGILMFVIFQGDRIIIGSDIGITELGWFSAAFTLTMAPSLVIAKTLQGFFLPQISRQEVGSTEFKFLCSVTNQISCFVGLLYVILFATVGPAIFLILYGNKYEPALSVLVLLAVMQGVRISRVGLSTIAHSIAATKIPLVANLFRISVFPITWIIVIKTSNLLAVASIAAIGEGLALVATLYLLRPKQIFVLAEQLIPTVLCTFTLIWIAFSNFYQELHPNQIILDPMFLVGVPFVAILFMPALRKWIRSLI